MKNYEFEVEMTLSNGVLLSTTYPSSYCIILFILVFVEDKSFINMSTSISNVLKEDFFTALDEVESSILKRRQTTPVTTKTRVSRPWITSPIHHF